MKRKKKAKINEHEVVVAIRSAFPPGDTEIWLTRYQVGGAKYDDAFVPYGEPGMPDFIGLIWHLKCPNCGKTSGEGTFVGVECKGSKGKLSPLQAAKIERIRAMGGIAVVIRPDPRIGILDMRNQVLDKIKPYTYCESCVQAYKAKGSR